MAISNTCNAVFVRLDENNYPIWSYVMHHHLRGHGLLKFVDGSHPCPPPFSVTTEGNHSANTSARALWFEQDSFLISLITNTLSAQALILVVGCETSMEVWTILKQRYGIISEFHVMQLKFAMQNIRKGSESIDKYLLRFKYIRDRLAVAGVEMSDLDVKYLILAGLPIEYGPTRQIIRGKKDIGMEDVRSLLLSAEYEIELKHKASSASHLVTHNGMMSSGNAYSTEMQWNGLVGIDVPYHCSVMPLSDVHNAYSIASGVSSLNAYNVFPSNAISQIGYVSPSTTMATDTRFIDTCASSISSSFLPSQVSQNNSCCAQPTGIFPQIGGGIQNGGSMQVPYGGAISQLHNDSLP